MLCKISSVRRPNVRRFKVFPKIMEMETQISIPEKEKYDTNIDTIAGNNADNKVDMSDSDIYNIARRYNHKHLTKLIETEDNEDILKWIRKEKLSLQCFSDSDKEPNCTLMSKILNEAENGDEIILDILDSCVTKTPVGSKKISSNSYNIKVDFSGIIREGDDGKQESILNDLVQLWLSYKTTPWDKIYEPIKKVMEICKCTKEREKEKHSPQIILGKIILHLDRTRQSNIIVCRYAVSSSTGSLY